MEDKTPKILYQTWKDKNLPDKFMLNQQKWLKTINYGSSDWKYVLLDDNDLRNLVKDNFPQYIKSYDSFTKNIERVDFARLVMMYIGGVYADLDTFPIRSIDEWVEKNKIILGREPVEHAKKLYKNREVVLCNAFMISPPGKELWVKMMDYIIANYEKNYRPVYNTGPMAMTLFMEDHPELFKSDDVIITDPCVFFPMLGTGEISDRCIKIMDGKETMPDTYVIHEWENTWVDPWYKNVELINARYWFWGLTSIFVILWLKSYYSKN